MFSFETHLEMTNNGQFILPQQAHKVLKTPKVRIIVEMESVRLEPISELAGCLKSYTKQLPMDEAREIAWTEAMYEKHLRD
jgi:hypothetical protein